MRSVYGHFLTNKVTYRECESAITIFFGVFLAIWRWFFGSIPQVSVAKGQLVEFNGICQKPAATTKREFAKLIHQLLFAGAP